MTVGKRLRFEVLVRDGFACRYCGATAPSVQLEVDHVEPQALVDDDTFDNLVTACSACNRGKSSVAPHPSTIAQAARYDDQPARFALADLAFHRGITDPEAIEAWIE